MNGGKYFPTKTRAWCGDRKIHGEFREQLISLYKRRRVCVICQEGGYEI